MKQENKLDIIIPFGPPIGITTIPKSLIDKINNFVDVIIKDKDKIKELDEGKYLAGQVSQEILLPKEIFEDELHTFLKKAVTFFVEYRTAKKISKFDFLKVWVVRQFKNEYNPTHWHNGHISGVSYLKLPDDFGSSIHPEKRNNDNGKINFVHGSRQFLSTSIITEKPELGKMFLFPNYLMHSVNPFYGKGERRSFSFNAVIDEKIYNIYSQ